MQGQKRILSSHTFPPADLRQAFEDFTTILAHDLNAPLRIISSFSQLLEQRYANALDDKALHYVDRIYESSRQAQTRLAALLQYSRLSTDPMAYASVDCNRLADHCLQQLHHDIDMRGVSIGVGLLPTLTADSERLELLLYNLISNAVKYGADHQPHIEISSTRRDENWLFCVRDNGPGISAAQHETIFQMFRRLPGSNSDGIGMGLSIAQRIAELHGGRLWVESKPGEGTSFYFTITDSGDDNV